METLNLELKGIIAKDIERALNQKNLSNASRWAVEVDVIQCGTETRIEDFTLGYVLGFLRSRFEDRVYWARWDEKNRAKYDRDMLKALGKKEFYKQKAEYELKSKMAKSKGGRPLKITVTKSEKDEIKRMLEPVVEQFRRKISLELREFMFSKDKR